MTVELVELKCKNCGAPLKVDGYSIKCPYCGTNYTTNGYTPSYSPSYNTSGALRVISFMSGDFIPMGLTLQRWTYTS